MSGPKPIRCTMTDIDPDRVGDKLTLDRCAAALGEVRERYAVIILFSGTCIVIDMSDFPAKETGVRGSEADCQAWISREAARACIGALLPVSQDVLVAMGRSDNIPTNDPYAGKMIKPAPGDDRICPLCLTPGMAFAGDQWAECHHCGVYCSKSQDEQLAAAQREIETWKAAFKNCTERSRGETVAKDEEIADRTRQRDKAIEIASEKDTLLATMAQALQKGREMADTVERGMVLGVPQVQSVARAIVQRADQALVAYDQHTKGSK